MKMKKYNAPSIAEAMKLIRADLGDDAVILNSKVVTTKKFFGLVKQKSFEVVAGVDRVEKKTALPPLSDFPGTLPVPASVEVAAATGQMKVETQMTEELKKEIADLKSIMQSLQRHSIQTQYPDELLPFLSLIHI